MSSTLRRFGFDRLSLAERILLVEDLWDSIADEVESLPIPESHEKELELRLAAFEADPSAGSSWDDVKARLTNRPSSHDRLLPSRVNHSSLPELDRDDVHHQAL